MTAFDVLGLAASSQLTDDDVRSAWRRIAAATHPDRADGGDPEAFATAAAAYTTLRTAARRAEMLAELRDPAGGRVPGRPVPGRKAPLPRILLLLAWRIRQGRPGRLALQLLGAAAPGALAVAAVGWQPASLAVITGTLTWLVLTGRGELAARRRE
jgi:curved DNA-binding protein CbpA